MWPCIELYKLDGVDGMNGSKDSSQSKMLIYTTEDGLAKIETTFDGDTVWLSIDQMAELFQRDRSVIGNGQWLKSIKFKLPIIAEDMSLSLDNDTHVETVCTLSQSSTLKKDTCKE